MRTKINLSEMPPAFTVTQEGDQAIITFYTDVQEVPSVGESPSSPSYDATAWTITRCWTSGLSSRIEANIDKWLEMAQGEAYEVAAAKVREKRNELLVASDSTVALDRINLPTPSGSAFTAWLSFLQAIASAVSGSWAIYRQQLRDIPAQSGFPFDIEWPAAPEE